jgi:hypothetical protein
MTMAKVGKSMTDEQFEADLLGMITPKQSLVQGMAPERLKKLKDLFHSMDEDGDGTVDLSEYRAATTNETMLKLFEYMDGQGDKNGQLTLDGQHTASLAMKACALERALAPFRPPRMCMRSSRPLSLSLSFSFSFSYSRDL